MRCNTANSRVSQGTRGYPRIVVLALSAMLLGACVPEHSAVRDDFGNSVRAEIANQIYKPGSKADGLDGGMAVNVMREYRSSVAKPENVKQDIIINMDTGN